MSDFTTFNLQYNTGTDASPTWTGTAIAFGGTSGANELRWASSGATTTTASASWPYITRTASVFTVAQLWAFTSDAVGLQVNTYTGTNANSNVLRWNWDSVGTFAAAPQFSLFNSTAHTTPTAGDGSIAGGNSTDTSSTSYLKINAYGYGVDTGGTQQTPAAGSLTTAVAATDGTAGAVSPGTGAWIATHWQSAQGWTQYILDAVVPKATTAGFWYWTCVMYVGPGMTTGTLTPVITMQYSYS